jgi:hypothetical protein
LRIKLFEELVFLAPSAPLAPKEIKAWYQQGDKEKKKKKLTA